MDLAPALNRAQALLEYGNDRPKCFCNLESALRQTQKGNGNWGRWFWSCSQTPACEGFFVWADGGTDLSKVPPPPPGMVNVPQNRNIAPQSPPAPRARRPAAAIPHRSGAPMHAPALHNSHPQLHLQQHHGWAGGQNTPMNGMAGGWAQQGAASPVYMSPGASCTRAPMQSAGPVTPLQNSRQIHERSAPMSQPTPPGRRLPASMAGPSSQPSQAPKMKLQFERSTSDEVAIQFEYDSEVIEDLKRSFPYRDRKWDKDSKRWKFPADKYDNVKEWALRHYGEFEIRFLTETNEAEWVDEAMLPRHAAEGIRESFIPDGIWNQLYGFQKEGVIFGLQHHGRILLADDMGLGKTVQAICIAACYWTEWPLLIVCPSSMVLTWFEKLNDWLPERILQKKDLVVITSGKDVSKKLSGYMERGPPPDKHHILIASYDCAQKLQGYEQRFPMLICDESHMLKNRDAKRTQFFTNLVTRRDTAVKHLLLLTGTAAMSKPIELYTQIDMLKPGLFGTYDDFGQRFCGAKVQVAPGKMEYKGFKNLTELNGILSAQLLIRRLKKNVLGDLPPLTRSRKTVLPDDRCMLEIERVKAEMDELDRMAARLGEEEHNIRSKTLMSKLYRLSGSAKVKAAEEHLGSLLEEEKKKVLVFAHHDAVLSALEEAVKKMQKRYIRIDGSHSAQERAKSMDMFQSDDKCRVALLSIKAAGAGITLNKADTVVFVELSWNPADLTQAESRAHRIGQEAELDVQYLVAPGTADEIIWRVVNRKLQVVGNVLDGHLAGTATGLKITDASRFSNWRAVQELAQGSVPEAELMMSTPADANNGNAASPMLSTPEAAVKAQPTGRSPSTRRRQRRKSSSASPEVRGRGGAAARGKGRRRLDFDAAAPAAADPHLVDLTSEEGRTAVDLTSQASNNHAQEHDCANSSAPTSAPRPAVSTGILFSDSDSLWSPLECEPAHPEVPALPTHPDGRISSEVEVIVGTVPGAGGGITGEGHAGSAQRSVPVAARHRGGGGGGGSQGVMAADDDAAFEEGLGSPEMQRLMSQPQGSVGGQGVLENDDDAIFEAGLGSPEMQRLMSQTHSSQQLPSQQGTPLSQPRPTPAGVPQQPPPPARRYGQGAAMPQGGRAPAGGSDPTQDYSAVFVEPPPAAKTGGPADAQPRQASARPTPATAAGVTDLGNGSQVGAGSASGREAARRRPVQEDDIIELD